MKKIFLVIFIFFAFFNSQAFCANDDTIINPNGTYNQPKKESSLTVTENNSSTSVNIQKNEETNA